MAIKMLISKITPISNLRGEDAVRYIKHCRDPLILLDIATYESSMQNTNWYFASIIQNPHATPDVLKQIVNYSIKENECTFICMIFENNLDSLDPEFIRFIYNKYHKSKITNQTVYFYIAKHPSCPYDLLLKFSKSNNFALLSGLSYNPSIDSTIILNLLKHKNEHYNNNLLYNPALTPELKLFL